MHEPLQEIVIGSLRGFQKQCHEIPILRRCASFKYDLVSQMPAHRCQKRKESKSIKAHTATAASELQRPAQHATTRSAKERQVHSRLRVVCPQLRQIANAITNKNQDQKRCVIRNPTRVRRRPSQSQLLQHSDVATKGSCARFARFRHRTSMAITTTQTQPAATMHGTAQTGNPGDGRHAKCMDTTW